MTTTLSPELLDQLLNQEPAALEQAIAQLVARRAQPAGKAQVVAFVGAKGGVGTTTTAVNVAAALAKHSKRPTLLADLHVAYGDAAVFLGAEPRFSWLDALENIHRLDAEFLKSLVVKTASGVELLASGDRAASTLVDAGRLHEIVQLASSQYAHTVLDVPRSDATALDGLDHADQIVVVVNQELATVRNGARLAAALRSRYPNATLKTVINRIDAKAEIGPRDILKAVGGSSAHECPDDYRRALAAMHAGRPLALDNHNALSASLTALARELGGLEPAKAAKAPGGLKALFSGRR
jgi:pilus assembly protein CpaE